MKEIEKPVVHICAPALAGASGTLQLKTLCSIADFTPMKRFFSTFSYSFSRNLSHRCLTYFVVVTLLAMPFQIKKKKRMKNGRKMANLALGLHSFLFFGEYST